MSKKNEWVSPKIEEVESEPLGCAGGPCEKYGFVDLSLF